MTKVQAILKQIKELSDSEFYELCDIIDYCRAEDTYELSPEQIAEIDRRIDDMDSGKDQGIDADEVFAQLRATLQNRRRPA